MDERTTQLLDTLVGTYSDRLDDEQLDALEEFLGDDDLEEALLYLARSLRENRAPITEDELADLEELYTLLEVDQETLELLDVE